MIRLLQEAIRASRLTPAEVARAALWLAIAVPAVYQLDLLVTAVAGRLTYPYDLEWMEGGMLHHALRIQQGQGIYVPPSIDFIPYLYTPLYPGLLALLGNAVGLSYTLGRTISVIALLAIAAVAFGSIAGPRHDHAQRGPALAGAALALGLFAATYPFVEGWFDLVRADTLFLAIATIGIAACARWATIGGDDGREPEIRVGVAATILVLGFFTKQTGLFYVALGGAVVLVISWQRVLAYVRRRRHAGARPDLGAQLDQRRLVLDLRVEDPPRPRLQHGPVLGVVRQDPVALPADDDRRRHDVRRGRRRDALRAARRRSPPHLAAVADAAVPAVDGDVRWCRRYGRRDRLGHRVRALQRVHAGVPARRPRRRRRAARARRVRAHPARAPAAWAGACGADRARARGLALGYTLLHASWQPERFVPTDADVAAGDKLIRELRAIPGDVWMPSHPWYLELAGKTPHVHRMGIKDVTAREPRPVRGLEDALRTHAFSAIVFDNSDLPGDGQPELAALRQLIAQSYRIETRLPADEQPRVYTGAQVRPDAIWVPAVPATPPAGAHTLFDFEQTTWDGWTRTGTAWGRGPATDVPGVPIAGTTGRRFASSVAGGGDNATGRLVSPAFPLHAARITMKIGGTVDPKLRVELEVVDDSGIGAVVRTATVPAPGGPTLQEVGWDVRDVANQMVRLVLVDDSQARGGYLVVDDVWSWDR